jgi:hypothetical protein
MSQDLPVMLAQPPRGLIRYINGSDLRLYFLDQHAWPPEPPGMWISGAGRAEIIVRSINPIDHLAVEAESPIATTLTLSMGADAMAVPLQPGRPVAFDLPAGAPVPGRYGDSVYLMRAQSSDGFVPHLTDPASNDYRNLGALIRFRAY